MSNTKDELIHNIKNWIELDNDVKLLSKQLKEVRNKKKSVTNTLIETMKNNEIDCFDLSNGKILYGQNKIKRPLNKETLLASLSTYFADSSKDSIDKITKHILDSRQVVLKDNIRFKEPK